MTASRCGGVLYGTLQRLLRSVDIEQLEGVLVPWVQQVRLAWNQHAARWLHGIAIDGKTLRGARGLGAARADARGTYRSAR